MQDPGIEARALWDRLADAYQLDLAAAEVRALGSAGGFSDARFWRIERPDAMPLCVRRWPAGQIDAERLSWMHSVLAHVASQGCDFVPLPLPTRDGASFAEAGGHLWELSPWMPGEPDVDPSPARLVAAMQALAKFHLAAASFGATQTTNAPGIARRVERLASLREGRCASIARAVERNADSQFAAHAPLLIEVVKRAGPALTAALVDARDRHLPLQLCIRDIKAEHILFVANEVRGLIDFGGLAADVVASDIARLLGTLARDDAERFHDGLAAYASVRPLSAEEQALVHLLDMANVTLGGIQWLEWIFLDGRVFDDASRVLQRLDEAAARVTRLLDRDPANSC